MNLTTDELKKLKTGLFKLMEEGIKADSNVALQAAELLIRLVQLSCRDVVDEILPTNSDDIGREHVEPDTPWPRK